MKKLTLLFAVFFATFNLAQAQTLDDLKSMKADKQAALDALAAEVADLDAQISTFPGWKIGGVGVLGFDLNSNSDWYALNLPNSTANGYGISAGLFANNDSEKTFWRNTLAFNLKKSNTTLDASLPDAQQVSVSTLTDAIDVSSLAGYKLAPKWALSAEGKYITSLFNFNNPGQLTLSAGATWLPIDNMVVVIHPLGYQLNFPSGDFVSSAGAKIGVTYGANILPNVAWASNLSYFLPYGGGDGTLKAFVPDAASTANDPKFTDTVASELAQTYGTGDLTNWTWINTFSTKILNGIGVGLNVGLRSDKQIANQARFNSLGGAFDPATADNPIQLYYSLGLAYTL